MKNFLPKTFFGMTFLFASIIFFAMVCTVVVSAVTTFFVVRSDIIPTTAEMVPLVWTTCAVMAGISFPVGALVALLMSKMPLRPIREMMEGMDRLAGGDFRTRIVPGRIMGSHPQFVGLTESFNKMAEQLEHTELLRSDFINNFSHEFKTPIASIAGFAQVLRRGNLTPEQTHEYLMIIEEESLRLSYMATNVLNLTKIENQTILTDLTTYNLSEQIRGCILLLEDEWTRKNLELQIDFDEIFVTANEEMMKQVFINLLDNAIKFASEAGFIRVEIQKGEQVISISVSNSGPEIPAESREKVFRKFYQADESHATTGNGIGLAIVKRVTELHEGTVSLKCENGVNTFIVKLPIHDRRKDI